MPKPIVCLSDQLRQFVTAFRTCFTKRQWKYFIIVLLALIECEERRTMTGLLPTIGDRVSLSGLSRFLNKWPWSPDKLANAWCQRFRQRMIPLVQARVAHQRLKAERPKCVGRPKATVVIGSAPFRAGYLIFDDSVHVKLKGRKMGGQGRHYSSTEGRVVNGHCLVTGLYVLVNQRYPLPAQMYRQKGVCEREGVPFASKIDMVVQQIQDFEPTADTRTGIIRFWTLTACLLCFLEEQRAMAPEPGLTCGDIRRRIQEEHRRNLLIWLYAQFQAGRTIDKVGIQLAVSSS